MLYSWKRSVAIFVSALFVLAIGVGLKCGNVDRFSAVDGEKTYYLFDASSQALQKRTLRFRDVFFVRGQSVAFENAELEIESLLQEYAAQTLVMETVGNVTSYYCYSPVFGAGVSVNGYEVNLHIAKSGTRYTLGTPIIFGGF